MMYGIGSVRAMLPELWDVYRDEETGLGRVEFLFSRPGPDCTVCAQTVLAFCHSLQKTGMLQTVTALYASERLTGKEGCFHICCVDFLPGKTLSQA